MTSAQGSAGGGGAAGGSYETHLQSLRDFADELRQQLTALSGTTEVVHAAAAQEVRLGHFAEAHLLRDRHAEAQAQVAALLVGIGQAIAFAEQVTDTVADSYERGDHETAAILGGAGGGA